MVKRSNLSESQYFQRVNISESQYFQRVNIFRESIFSESQYFQRINIFRESIFSESQSFHEVKIMQGSKFTGGKILRGLISKAMVVVMKITMTTSVAISMVIENSLNKGKT